jgi:chloramphenicol-sensitive protein RarD
MGTDNNLVYGNGAASARAGLISGISAYAMWGVFPVYFYFLRDVSPLVVLCHRILGSCIFLVLVVNFRKEWRSILPLLSNRRVMLLLMAGALLIAVNWLVFIYAIGVGQMLQSSLGYFINPVFSVALGMIFLGEKLRRWQWVAVGVAVTAVLNLAIRGTGVPWIALTLALSFGFYGLVRKEVNINSLHALLVESTLLVPFAAVLLAVLPNAMGGEKFPLLSVSGILTATPLLLFGMAVRRLKLSTMGFLQYIGPTLQFLLAVAVFHEPLDRVRLASFLLCWIAIGIYVIDSLRAHLPQAVADEPD